jgi:lysine-N-methylase
MDSPLGEDLRRHLFCDEEGDWYFKITEGRCPMWRSDGLCRIQADLGHDALCQTCRDFPRLTHDFGDFVERGLELSCPEAARMIFSEAPGWVEQEIPGGEEPEYDDADMEILLETREEMLRILADTTRSVPETLALALLYGYRAQDRLDGGEAGDFDPVAELAFGKTVAKPGDRAALLDFYAGLEILTEAWRQRLAQPAGDGSWDDRLRILARYGVERYWLQAISDFDLVGRVKMIVLSCLLVRHLGGDLVGTAQLYAKEIENNAENVDTILDGAYTSPALTDDKLLGLLLL